MMLISVAKLQSMLLSFAQSRTKGKVKKANSELCKMIIADTDRFVPYDTGNLAKKVRVLSGNTGVEYYADYAEYVNVMPESNNFTRTTHPDATSHWGDASIAVNRDKWVREYSRMVGGK